MTEQQASKQITLPTDKETILAALKLLGISNVQVRNWERHGTAVTEVFAGAIGEELSEGGFRFTLTDGKLTELAARNLHEGCDEYWLTSVKPEDPRFALLSNVSPMQSQEQ